MSLANTRIAELLARKAEDSSYPLKRALRRAGRTAFLWQEEAANLLEQGRSLTELPSVGPFLEKLIRGWIENPPPPDETPETRRHFLSIPEARRILASDADWLTGIKGDLQMHTEWSDGSGKVPQMAEAGEERGYEYIAITDHSKGLKIAGGITEEELGEQGVEIDELNQALASQGRRIRVLRSIELNLSPTGEGDLDPSALQRLDLVLGSFHSALRRTEDQTDRYLAALRNPHLNILGHPRGRIYNYRDGLSADWPRVFALAAELDKAVEIDCYPDRQDLSLDLLKVAQESGCRISIGTDAHHPWQLAFIELGIAAARLAGLDRERILNYMPRDQLLKWARQRCATRTSPDKGRTSRCEVPVAARRSQTRTSLRLATKRTCDSVAHPPGDWE